MKFGLAPGASAYAIVPEPPEATVADADGPMMATPSTRSVAMASRRVCPTFIVRYQPVPSTMARGTAPETNGSFQRYLLIFALQQSGQSRRKYCSDVRVLETEAGVLQRRGDHALAREDRGCDELAAQHDVQSLRRNPQSRRAMNLARQCVRECAVRECCRRHEVEWSAGACLEQPQDGSHLDRKS